MSGGFLMPTAGIRLSKFYWRSGSCGCASFGGFWGMINLILQWLFSAVKSKISLKLP